VIDGIRSRCLAAVSKRQKKPGAIARRDFEEQKKVIKLQNNFASDSHASTTFY
jgi:hypothetical protein